MNLINTVDITIWDRQFTLPVEYEYYSEETITEQQQQAVESFIAHPEWIIKAKSIIEQYCFESVMEDEENSKKNNVFSYVKPEYLFVKRDKKNPRTALMCKYRYDLEHGLAIIFSSDGNIVVGSQDMIL